MKSKFPWGENYPDINSDFWKQFHDPHRAYSNYYGLFMAYLNDKEFNAKPDSDYCEHAMKAAKQVRQM